uniref:thioredoxin-dependent peroxiredoxin n=1 Tax=Eutreptiella gymnastica TaxID=73025 RepID=A0A7S4LLZ3_9EUGL|mmetsp:Transcript_11286/g.17388  ORF Transcript_11286/g.17388 Transcript_11286/m.17388 type:complete len:231 (+) Transcript_11286:52-744(+)
MKLALLIVVALMATCSATMPLCGSDTPRALRPRLPAPAWKGKAVVDEKFVDVSSKDYAGQWLVLFFYPFDFTFVCPTEIVSFSESVSKFKALGASVVGVSTDSHHTHLAWIRTPRENGGLGGVDIPLVADISKQISRDYGVLVDDPEDGMYGAALRGLFIIDPKGIVRSVQINDDHVGRSVDETLRLIKAFQFADKNGKVCPANWQPGDDAMEADPEGSKKFFTKWGEGR